MTNPKDKNDRNKRWTNYKEDLVKQFWNYQKAQHGANSDLFEKTYEEDPKRPPVFLRIFGYKNLLINEDCKEEIKERVRRIIPKGEWHKHFTSMTSSQALAQSVFGNLEAFEKTGLLASLLGDDGKPLFIIDKSKKGNVIMEKAILYLGETARKTMIDAFFEGEHQVAVECKLTEPEVGPCSRPKLKRNAPNYDDAYCNNGQYVRQGNRNERCSLTEIGVQYWHHIPKFFKWDPSVDHVPCPLNETYQLVRNVLAACLRPKPGSETEAIAADGHVVLLYDKRNPQFQEDGKGWKAFRDVKEALLRPESLQSCTWQQVVTAISEDQELAWLVEGLRQKYGIEAA